MSSQDVINYRQRIPAHIRNAISRLNPAIADRVFYYLAKEDRNPQEITQEIVAGWVIRAQEQYDKAVSIPLDVSAITTSMIEFESGDFLSYEELASGV